MNASDLSGHNCQMLGYVILYNAHMVEKQGEIGSSALHSFFLFSITPLLPWKHCNNDF